MKKRAFIYFIAMIFAAISYINAEDSIEMDIEDVAALSSVGQAEYSLSPAGQELCTPRTRDLSTQLRNKLPVKKNLKSNRLNPVYVNKSGKNLSANTLYRLVENLHFISPSQDDSYYWLIRLRKLII